MLIELEGIEDFIATLPDDPWEALPLFDSWVKDELGEFSESSRYTRIELDLSYLFYIRSFTKPHDIHIVNENNLIDCDPNTLKNILNGVPGKIARGFLENKEKKLEENILSAIQRKKNLLSRLVVDEALKSEIRHYAEQIKQCLTEADITQSKREELLKKLNDFISAVDQGRSWNEKLGDAYFAFKVEARDNVEWGLKSLEWFEKLVGKLTKSYKSLPAPENAGQLPPPPERLPAPDKKADEEDAA